MTPVRQHLCSICTWCRVRSRVSVAERSFPRTLPAACRRPQPQFRRVPCAQATGGAACFTSSLPPPHPSAPPPLSTHTRMLLPSCPEPIAPLFSRPKRAPMPCRPHRICRMPVVTASRDIWVVTLPMRAVRFAAVPSTRCHTRAPISAIALRRVAVCWRSTGHHRPEHGRAVRAGAGQCAERAAARRRRGFVSNLRGWEVTRWNGFGCRIGWVLEERSGGKEIH